ncbi:MAG: lysophospholipid acyltransferase family protein [Candidatus Cloacimonadaceae bacterium]|nr:lysophospholipid acyltransferase family protein [Candidatus Cloacimonadaceae bacterium]
MNKLLFYLEKKLAAWVLRLLKQTLKIRVVNQNPDSLRCVYMFWHRNLLIMTIQRMWCGVGVLISSSKDGELIAGPVSELGYIPIRGSSTRQGSQALKEMIRRSREISLAITPDGPKGPVFTIHPGIYQIALLGKLPIIPIVAHADREWVFNSWDRFRVPKPFAKLTIIYGDPIYLTDKELIPDTERRIREFMESTEKTILEGKS